MRAVGAYLGTLREGRKISRQALAASVGTSVSQLFRIEEEGQETRGSLLIAIVAALRGKLDDVMTLMLDKNATAEDGARAAHKALSEPDEPAQRIILRQRLLSLPPDDLDLIGEIAERLLQSRQSQSEDRQPNDQGPAP